MTNEPEGGNKSGELHKQSTGHGRRERYTRGWKESQVILESEMSWGLKSTFYVDWVAGRTPKYSEPEEEGRDSNLAPILPCVPPWPKNLGGNRVVPPVFLWHPLRIDQGTFIWDSRHQVLRLFSKSLNCVTWHIRPSFGIHLSNIWEHVNDPKYRF